MGEVFSFQVPLSAVSYLRGRCKAPGLYKLPFLGSAEL